MPLRDKLTIAFTILVLIVGPYLTYVTIEAWMDEDARVTKTLTDGAATPVDREETQVKQRKLPSIYISQIAVLVVAQVGMVGLSALLIRDHRRCLKLGQRK